MGQTGREYFRRNQEHLYRFRRPKKFKSLVYQHLDKHNHNLKYIKFQPLETVQKQPGESHKQFEKSREVRELFWIKRLQTAYPLGLNDKILGQGNISKTHIDVINIVDKRLRNNRSHGKRKNRNQRIKHRINYTLADLLSIIKNNGRHQVLCKLGQIPISKLYAIFLECDKISFFSPFYEYTRIITAFCHHRLFPIIDKPENHKRHFLKLKYINRGIDFINLSSIFNDSSVYSLIPPYFDNIEQPIISYSYKKPSRNLIFNYTSITTDVNIENNVPST